MKANPNTILKQGWVTKLGNKPTKKITKRLMVVRPKNIQWYHNESELRKNKPLGVIYLASIYHCLPANRFKNTSDINVI